MVWGQMFEEVSRGIVIKKSKERKYKKNRVEVCFFNPVSYIIYICVPLNNHSFECGRTGFGDSHHHAVAHLVAGAVKHHHFVLLGAAEELVARAF